MRSLSAHGNPVIKAKRDGAGPKPSRADSDKRSGLATGLATAGPLLHVAADDRLVEAVREGNERAFEVIYDRHNRELLSFCRHMLGCHHEAEDAVQQTFLNAYKAIREGEAEINLRPWLYRIARNHSISVLRQRQEQPAEFIEIATEGLSEQVERREELRAVLADIKTLPEDQRAALLLSELDTLSHEEIAEVLGCRKDRVKALVFRARKQLTEARDARDISCEEIREQLSVLRGGSLRRGVLSRHLRSCEGCRAFRDDVRRQRAAIAIILPVIPSVGLKALCVPSVATAAAGIVAAAGGSAGAVAAGVSGGSIASGPLAGIAAKAATVAAAGAIGAGGAVAVDRAVVEIPPLHRQAQKAPPVPPPSAAVSPAAAPLASPSPIGLSGGGTAGEPGSRGSGRPQELGGGSAPASLPDGAASRPGEPSSAQVPPGRSGGAGHGTSPQTQGRGAESPSRSGGQGADGKQGTSRGTGERGASREGKRGGSKGKEKRGASREEGGGRPADPQQGGSASPGPAGEAPASPQSQPPQSSPRSAPKGEQSAGQQGSHGSPRGD